MTKILAPAPARAASHAPLADVPDLLRSLKARDALRLVGTAGYSLPDLKECEIAPFFKVQTEGDGKIVFKGRVTAKSGLIVRHKRHNLSRPLEITCFPSTYDAIVVIGEDCTLHGHIALQSADALVVLSGGRPSVRHTGYFSARLASRGNSLFIGLGSTTNGTQYVLFGDGMSAIVGDDCMFAGDITIRTDDMHAIIDMTTGARVNRAAPVVFEPHVWLGQGATVLKGVVVGLGAVVGAQSLVAKACPRFTVSGGVPAKVIAENRSWDRLPVPPPDTAERMRTLASEVAPFAMPARE